MTGSDATKLKGYFGRLQDLAFNSIFVVMENIKYF